MKQKDDLVLESLEGSQFHTAAALRKYHSPDVVEPTST